MADCDKHVHNRNVQVSQTTLKSASVQLLQPSILQVFLLVRDADLGASDIGGRQAGGEDKSGSVGPDGIDHIGGSSDVSTHDAISLAESARDDVDTIHHGPWDGIRGLAGSEMRLKVQVFGDTGSSGSVHSNGMDLIQERDGAVLFGQVADLADGSDAAAHGVDALESDDLGGVLGEHAQLRLEVLEVVVPEDDLGRAGVTNALDHGRVVHVVAEDDAVGHLGSERREGGVVGDEARTENECRLLAMQGRELILEIEMERAISSNVSGPAGAGSVLVEGTAE